MNWDLCGVTCNSLTRPRVPAVRAVSIVLTPGTGLLSSCFRLRHFANTQRLLSWRVTLRTTVPASRTGRAYSFPRTPRLRPLPGARHTPHPTPRRKRRPRGPCNTGGTGPPLTAITESREYSEAAGSPSSRYPGSWPTGRLHGHVRALGSADCPHEDKRITKLRSVRCIP